MDKNIYFEYLELLRESGVTNMFGAAPFLQKRFKLNEKEARAILIDWMTSYEGKEQYEEV